MSKNEKNKSNFNARQIMADAKFYEAYSRFNPVTNKYETWEEATNRVMNMHRGYLKDKLNVYSDELWSMLDEVEVAYRDKLILGAQRALQFGGDQLIKHQARMYNCFHPDTEFITDKGTFSFNDFNHGDEVKVLTHTGLWKKALVKSYGHQKLNLVELSKNTNTTEVRVTKDHRWILKDGTETTNLSVGDNLYKPENTFGQFNYYDADPLERLYWCYGMVYGDGTRIQDKDGNNKYSLIRLCNTDKQFAERFEEVGFKSSTNASLKGDFIAYTGTYLKTAPNPEVDSPELIRAFVAGYLQADGEKNNNPDGAQYKTIQSSEQDHIDFIRKCFPIAGVYIISETDLTGQETNYGTRPYTIRFRISDSFGSKYNSGWKVTNIKEDITENVWCLEVEDDKSFILPNGIVTGNCSASYCDRAAFFGEAFYLMLCGCGVGFSVQHHHVAKLPAIQARTSESVEFVVEDSIEGWAKAADVLMSSFFVGGGKHPEYEGKKIYFNLEKIRPKGSLISGGFKAPGPEPLRIALGKIEDLIKSELSNKKHRIRPIVAYDITMFIADAVISGGVRRSATICLFSKDDEDMLNAKTGDWYTTQQQRGRSNNSAVLLRDKTTLAELQHIMKSVKDVGEPGFIFADNLESLFNPCVEVGMRGYDDEFVPQEKAETGFQFCNLTEENGAKSTTKEIFFEQCKYASILGTVQAAYTDFKFVSQATINITMREALIGVGITGWMNNPDILFNPDIMREGANIVKYWNKKTAKLIGINQAARTTVVKPSGNASVLLGCASGIHGEHSPKYFRHVQMNKEGEIAKLFMEKYPDMCETSVWSQLDVTIAFPVVSEPGSRFKSDLLGVKQLEYVKAAQDVWIEEGTNYDLCVEPWIRHNVSNTITVDDWDAVTEYVYKNRYSLCGISFLSAAGDRAYPQAPFTEVLEFTDIIELYGEPAMFTSALITAGLEAFNQDLWTAINTALGYGEELNDSHEHLLKRDFVRRFNKFSVNFNSNEECANCLKDVYNLHKWWRIQKTNVSDIDWTSSLKAKEFADIDTMGAQACSGSQCEIAF